MVHFLALNTIDNEAKDRFWYPKSIWKNKDSCIYVKAYPSNDNTANIS